jgi:hypothetical protein
LNENGVKYVGNQKIYLCCLNALRHTVTVNYIYKLTFHIKNTLFLLTATKWVSLFREKIYINSDNYAKSINTICGQYETVVNVNENNVWNLSLLA